MVKGLTIGGSFYIFLAGCIGKGAGLKVKVGSVEVGSILNVLAYFVITYFKF